MLRALTANLVTHERIDESQGAEPGGSSIRVSPLSRLRGRVRWEPRAWVAHARRRVRQPGFVHEALPPTLLGLCLVGSSIMLGWMASTLYFLWADDYDFLLLRGTLEGVNDGWLAPHDDHWSSGTILIYRILFAFFGMREYISVVSWTSCLSLTWSSTWSPTTTSRFCASARTLRASSMDDWVGRLASAMLPRV